MKFIYLFVLFLFSCGEGPVNNVLKGEILSVSLVLNALETRQKALVVISRPSADFVGTPNLSIVHGLRLTIKNF